MKLAYQNGIAGIKDKSGCYTDATPGYGSMLQLKQFKHIIGASDLELATHATNPEHYNQVQFAEELIAEDEEVMRNKQLYIFECQIVHNQPVFALVHKRPYIENNKITGSLFTALQFSHLPKTAINCYLNNADVMVSGHTEKYLKILGFSTERKYNLSKRELECIHYLIEGCSTYDIALKLGLSKRTIEFYIRNIKDKLGVSKATEIVAIAIAEGI